MNGSGSGSQGHPGRALCGWRHTCGLILLLPFALLLFGGCQSFSAARPPAPRRILFIGNSLTYYNGGLEKHVKALADFARPPKQLEADRATKGGATLRILQELPWVHDRIRDGGYDTVIVQEDIPELTEHSVAPFFEPARRFDQEIRAAGGRTVLFMAWPYERLNWVSLEQIAQAHRDLGHQLGVTVAPVGLAFQRATQARPELAMLGRDQEHPSLSGTYLAANVIYATLFWESPEGLAYHPTALSAEDAAFLQRIAWKTVQDWRKQRWPRAQVWGTRPGRRQSVVSPNEIRASPPR